MPPCRLRPTERPHQEETACQSPPPDATALDLFAGAGGASLGLAAAGFAVLAAVEWDADAAATYRPNLGDHVVERDVATVRPDDLPDAAYWHASPPCQGFSSAGKRDPADPRNGLWAEVYRLVAAKRPAFLTIENVLGMSATRMDRRILAAFEGLGYRGQRWVLNAADYGVPQTRKRVFLVFSRDGMPVNVPEPTHAKPPRHLMFGLAPWVTVRQALGIGGTMQSARHSGSPWYDGDQMPARAITADSRTGRGFDEAAPLLMTDHHRGNGKVYDGASRPARTVTEHARSDHGFILDEPSRALRHGAHGQPGYSPRHVAGTDHEGRIHDRPAHSARLRRLTVRECAILQDFPPDYEFVGSQTERYRQAGNAVPRRLAQAVASAILAALRGAAGDAV